MSQADEHVSRIPTPPLVTTRDISVEDLTQLGEDQQPLAPAQQASSRGHLVTLVWEIVQTVLLTIAIFLAVRTVVQNFRVEGASMDPTLKSGQFILANKAEYWRLDDTPIQFLIAPTFANSSVRYVFGGPTRGDIVVFLPPGQNDKDYIKRVIGLPGDEVRISQGRVIVNGRQLAELYVANRSPSDMDARRVPADSYFVLGDNRPNSSDSRAWGFVPADRMIGRAWVSYWPPPLWGIVPRVPYESPS